MLKDGCAVCSISPLNLNKFLRKCFCQKSIPKLDRFFLVAADIDVLKIIP